MKKVQTPRAPRRDKKAERIEYQQRNIDRLFAESKEATAKASDIAARAESACLILVAERADLLARVQRIDVLLGTLGVRRQSFGSPNVEIYPRATDLMDGGR